MAALAHLAAARRRPSVPQQRSCSEALPAHEYRFHGLASRVRMLII